jgi:hypothetical protein
MLDHERLNACTVVVTLDGTVVAIARKAGRGQGWLCDQSTRASVSVVLNLAEALGREGRIAPGCCESRGGQPLSWMRH